jgi:hypothetical protein
MANAEWLRACDEVRRFGPFAGQLGEWRVMCEGCWTGAIPQGFPDIDDSDERSNNGITPTEGDRGPSRSTEDINRTTNTRRVAEQNHADSTGQRFNGERGREYPASTVGTSFTRSNTSQPASSVSDGTQNSASSSRPSSRQERQNNAAYDSERDGPSVATLASFPSPPTHLPLPFPSTASSSQTQHTHLQPQINAASPMSSSSAESPVSDDRHGPGPNRYFNDSPTSMTPSERQNQPLSETPQSRSSDGDMASLRDIGPKSRVNSAAHRKGDYLAGEPEFGGGYARGTQKGVDNREKAQDMNRSDTAGSSGSMVAAMRHRYSNQVSYSRQSPFLY